MRFLHSAEDIDSSQQKRGSPGRDWRSADWAKSNVLAKSIRKALNKVSAESDPSTQQRENCIKDCPCNKLINWSYHVRLLNNLHMATRYSKRVSHLFFEYELLNEY